MGKAMVLASLHRGASIAAAVAMQLAMVLVKSKKLKATINWWWDGVGGNQKLAIAQQSKQGLEKWRNENSNNQWGVSIQLGGIVCHTGVCKGTGKCLHPNSCFGGMVMATGNLRKRETIYFISFATHYVILSFHCFEISLNFIVYFWSPIPTSIWWYIGYLDISVCTPSTKYLEDSCSAN